MKLILRVVFFFFAFCSRAHAESLVLPAGIVLEPDPSLDISYQILQNFDEKEKVIAGWDGEKLQYSISTIKLPPGWPDYKKYFQGLTRDLSGSVSSLKAGRSGGYKTASSLSGHYLEVQFKFSAKAEFSTQIYHFITDGKKSVVAIATLVDKGAQDRMLEDSKLLFQSAFWYTGAPLPDVEKSETPYVGTWKWSGAAPNGAPAVSLVTLKDDLTFTSNLTVAGKLVFSSVGYWAVSGKQLLWTYSRSQPELPEDKRKDEDDIVSLNNGHLILHSKLSGENREFIKQ